jgi:outer membrane biosynthesis protein TonB
LGLLLLPLLGMAAQPMTYEMEAVGDIEIGPDGTVKDYRLDENLPKGVVRAVDRSVRLWKFEPIQVDGRPVIATTRMRLGLTAVPMEGDNFALKVTNVWFGEPQRRQALAPPLYPPAMQRAYIEGKVSLILKLDAGGNVMDVMPEQTSLSKDVKGKAANRWRRMLEESSVAAARSWKFTPTETVDGEATPSLIRVPVVFTMGGQWKGFIPGPIQPIPWLIRESVASQAMRDTLEDGQAQPLASRFKLAQEVIDTTL